MSLGKIFTRMTIVMLVIGMITSTAFAYDRGRGPKFHNNRYRNIIVVIPDGCSASIQTLARWYKGEALNLDEMVSGSVATYMANSVITGSAAAGTAFATGHKTTVRFLSVGPDGNKEPHLTGFIPTVDPYVPMATVLEGAKLRGKSTGLVATSRITHATPAAYACHIDDRDKDNEIMEHLVYQDLDVVFGGGKRHLIPVTEKGGKRTDGENLINVLIDRGYQFVETKTDMDALTSGRAWGMFASSHMAPDIDRQYVANTEPSLAEMTKKAIDLLSLNPQGFFLMIEASQVDWAGHANDPIYMVTDFLAFDEAVGKALDFAKKDGETLVIGFADHNTGALSLGHETSDFPPGYTGTTLEDLLNPLKGMKATSNIIASEIGEDLTISTIKAAVKNWWNIDISDTDAQFIIDNPYESKVGDTYKFLADAYAISEIVSKNHTVFGWTTHGHTGEDVPLWSYGKGRPVGHFDNTELAQIMARGFGINLDFMTKRLFIDATKLPNYKLDETDPENPVVKFGANVEMPTSKDLVIKDGETYNMEGITVHAPKIEKVFIPFQALRCIQWGVCK